MSHNGVRQATEGGFVTVEWMLAVTFSFLVMVAAVNIIAVQYGRGVIRSAADQGAHDGAGAPATVDSVGTRTTECETSANKLMTDLLHSSFDKNVLVQCQVVGNQMQATVSADFPAWLPLMPFDFHQASVADVILEQAPQ